MRRLALSAAVLLPLTTALSGCVSSVGSCNDFGTLPDAQARFDAASVVVVATVSTTDRTVEPDAIYTVHRATIERVVKGELTKSAIDLYAPSDQCFTDGRRADYLEKDPLDGVGRSVLYLSRDPKVPAYALVTTEALDPLPTGAPLPFSTTRSPTPSPS